MRRGDFEINPLLEICVCGGGKPVLLSVRVGPLYV